MPASPLRPPLPERRLAEPLRQRDAPRLKLGVERLDQRRRVAQHDDLRALRRRGDLLRIIVDLARDPFL